MSVGTYLHSEEDCSLIHIGICNHLPDSNMCLRSDKASLHIHLCLNKKQTVVKTVRESTVATLRGSGKSDKIECKKIQLFLRNIFEKVRKIVKCWKSKGILFQGKNGTSDFNARNFSTFT